MALRGQPWILDLSRRHLANDCFQVVKDIDENGGKGKVKGSMSQKALFNYLIYYLIYIIFCHILYYNYLFLV